MKAADSNLQAQVSQSRYLVGDKEKVIAALQEDKKRLEVSCCACDGWCILMFLL